MELHVHVTYNKCVQGGGVLWDAQGALTQYLRSLFGQYDIQTRHNDLFFPIIIFF